MTRVVFSGISANLTCRIDDQRDTSKRTERDVSFFSFSLFVCGSRKEDERDLDKRVCGLFPLVHDGQLACLDDLDLQTGRHLLNDDENSNDGRLSWDDSDLLPSRQQKIAGKGEGGFCLRFWFGVREFDLVFVWRRVSVTV